VKWYVYSCNRINAFSVAYKIQRVIYMLGMLKNKSNVVLSSGMKI